MRLQEFISNESIQDLNDPQPVEYIAPDLSHTSVEVSISPEMLDGQVDVDATLVKVVDTEEAVVALERYSELLSAYAQTGISEQSAAFLRVGLEQYNHILELTQPLVPSVEAFGGTMSRSRSTQVSLESIKDKSKQLLVQLKELCDKLIKLAIDLYHRVANDAQRLKEKVQGLKTKAQALGASPTQSTFDINAPASLLVGNKFVGQEVPALAGTVAYASTVYPNSLSSYVRQLAKVVAALDPAQVSMSTLQGSLERIPGPEASYRGGEQVLPGNVKLVFSDKDAGTGLTKSLNKRLTVAKQDAGQVASVKVKVSDKQTLIKRCDDLIKICDGIIKMGEVGDTVKPAVDELVKSAERVQQLLDEGEVTGEARSTAESFLRAITVIPKTVAKDGVDLVNYCYRTAGAYIAVLQHEIAAY